MPGCPLWPIHHFIICLFFTPPDDLCVCANGALVSSSIIWNALHDTIKIKFETHQECLLMKIIQAKDKCSYESLTSYSSGFPLNYFMITFVCVDGYCCLVLYSSDVSVQLPHHCHFSFTVWGMLR